MTAAASHRDLLIDLQQFLFFEARLLDEGRFDEWLGLLDDGIVYFMPTRQVDARPESVRAHGDLALFEDDKAYLRARVQRLNGPLAHAEDPPSRTRRLISNVTVRPGDAAGAPVEVRCNFIVFQSRLERTENFYVGYRTDHVRADGASWKITRREIVLDHAVIPRTISILL